MPNNLAMENEVVKTTSFSFFFVNFLRGSMGTSISLIMYIERILV